MHRWNFGDFGDLARTEILKLKELPNEGLESSWGALWLGIRTFFGFNIEADGSLVARNPGIPLCLLTYLTYLTLLTILTLLTLPVPFRILVPSRCP